MTRSHTHIALLRAVNVGGTGTLKTAELRALAEEVGFERVETYIQSGNLLFDSAAAPEAAKARLEAALATRMGKPVGALIRSPAELDAILAANPFPEAPPNRVLVTLLDEPADAAIERQPTPGGEQVRVICREVYVHFPDGQGASKLKLPTDRLGTARNLNTLRKLAEMAAARC